MKKNKHVYCTNCVNGQSLIHRLLEDKEIPKSCISCYPFNPEDSVPFNERPNYIQIKELII